MTVRRSKYACLGQFNKKKTDLLCDGLLVDGNNCGGSSGGWVRPARGICCRQGALAALCIGAGWLAGGGSLWASWLAGWLDG
jgi:hypothetical protein